MFLSHPSTPKFKQSFSDSFPPNQRKQNLAISSPTSNFSLRTLQADETLSVLTLHSNSIILKTKKYSQIVGTTTSHNNTHITHKFECLFVMGRRVPLGNISLIHPFLHFSILAASFAATIAIITTICSFRFRRKSEPTPPKAEPLDTTNETAVDTKESVSSKHEHEHENSPPIEKTEQKSETENNEFMIKELPLPPAMLHPKESFTPNNMKRAASERKTSFSLSLKMPTLPRNLSIAKNWDHLKEEKFKPLVKTEESVWMKTIILGDKCVPDEEDDPVIFEGKGKKISAYHPKTISSMSMSVSRQNSFLDSDALCASQSHTQEDKINNI